MSSTTLSPSPEPSTRCKNFKRSHSDISINRGEASVKKAKTAQVSNDAIRDKKKRPKKKKRKLSVVVVEDGCARVQGPRRGLSEPLTVVSPTVAKYGESSRGSSKAPPGDLSGDERDAEEKNSPTQGIEAVDPVDSKDRDSTSTQVNNNTFSVIDPLAGTARKDDKGKGKATDLSQRSAEEEIARLTRELAFKNSLIAKHEDLLAQTQQSITCQICLELMHKPYTLSPCGHSACYDCLVSWFKAPPSSDPDNNPILGLEERKKTCPHCRGVVQERPVLVWGVKDVVTAHVKSELLPGHFLPPPEDSGNKDGNTDPWDGIFRKPGKGAFARYHRHQQRFPGGPGILDEEDGGLFRCYSCLHEIWDGICSGCGREYGTGDDDVDIRDFAETDSDDDDEDGLGGRIPLGWLEAGLANGFAAFHRDLDDDDLHSDSDEDDYEGSFIDDDDVEDNPPANSPRPLRGEEVIILTDTEDGASAGSHVRNHHREPSDITEVHDTEEEEDDDDDEEIEANREPRLHGPYAIHSESEIEDDGNDGVDIVSSPSITRRAARAARSRRAAVILSDPEDEDEDEAGEEDSDGGLDLVDQMLAREREIYGDDGSRSWNDQQDELDEDDDERSEDGEGYNLDYY